MINLIDMNQYFQASHSVNHFGFPDGLIQMAPARFFTYSYHPVKKVPEPGHLALLSLGAISRLFGSRKRFKKASRGTAFT